MGSEVDTAKPEVNIAEAQDGKMYAVQVLRGIAALAVVFQHVKGYAINVFGEAKIFEIFPAVFQYGVFLFFCISGFIMTSLVMNSTSSYLFLKKRIIRIYPPYFCAVSIIIITKVIFFGSYSHPSLGKALTLLPYGQLPNVLAIEWTLVYEMLFYLISSVFANKKMQRIYPVFLVIWFAVIVIAHNFYGIEGTSAITWKTGFVSTFNICFIMGGAVYFIREKSKFGLSNRKRWCALVICTILVFLIYGKLFAISLLLVKYRAYIYALLFSVILQQALELKVKSTNIFVRLGDYSYGMYLIHAQVLWIIMTLFKNRGYSMSVGIGGIALVSALVAGWNFGKFEVWMHSKLRKTKWNVSTVQKQRIIAVGILLVVCMGIFTINPVGNIAMKAATQPSVQHAETPKTVPESAVKVTETGKFDNSKVIKRAATPGWVDNIPAKIIEKKATVELSGWTVDTEKLTVPKQVVAVCDGKILNAQLSWYQRQGVADLFKTNAVLNCGWKLNINGEALKEGTNHIEVYALLEEGNWISLKVKEPLEIKVSY